MLEKVSNENKQIHNDAYINTWLLIDLPAPDLN